jgi:HEAT repeat protein
VAEKNLARRIEEVSGGSQHDEALAARADLERVQSAGITTVGALIDAVNDATQDLDVRLSAISLLAYLREEEAVPALERAFVEAQDGDITGQTAHALDSFRAERSAPALVRALKEGRAAKQSAAAWVLGRLEVPETIRPLWAAAMDQALDVGVRGHAIEALGYLRAKEAVPDLIALLNDPSPELRYWAAFALGQIGDPLSIPALEQMASVDSAVLRDGRSLREEALDALKTIRGTNLDES